MKVALLDFKFTCALHDLAGGSESLVWASEAVRAARRESGDSQRVLLAGSSACCEISSGEAPRPSFHHPATLPVLLPRFTLTNGSHLFGRHTGGEAAP